MKEEDALDDDSLELAGLAPMTIFEGILVSKLPSLVPERVLAVAPELKELEFASKEIDNVLPLFSKIGLLVSKNQILFLHLIRLNLKFHHYQDQDQYCQ
jgi:hypothetical protein